MTLGNKKITLDEFRKERENVLTSWFTGKGISIEEGIKYQEKVPREKQFARALRKADEEGKTLIQPRAGVALLDEHIKLLKYLEEEADLLPTTIDAYTRQNRYEEAQEGIKKSEAAGHSLLNGFPAVNHGMMACREIVEQIEKPVEIRHGTPDARLLTEISYAAGFNSFEGGGISYNIPYAKKVPLEKSIRDWQYCDRLTGIYQEAGITINREPFGPLSGTLVPPFMSHAIALIEGLLALEQGVKSITLGYGQAGNLIQDMAAMETLRELGHRYFRENGHEGYELSTVFHQWMGGFPEDEARAFSVIAWGGAAAALSRATKVIVKTPHEAMGIPTKEANLQGLKATRQMIQMLSDQTSMRPDLLTREKEMISAEVDAVMKAVFQEGKGDWAVGAVKAFERGILDVPFAPSTSNAGKLLPVRDNQGAVRIFDPGHVPFPPEVMDFHREQLEARAQSEGRESSFQMVIDDIYAISKGRLVGRPQN